jgi:hypothetical protein
MIAQAGSCRLEATVETWNANTASARGFEPSEPPTGDGRRLFHGSQIGTAHSDRNATILALAPVIASKKRSA